MTTPTEPAVDVDGGDELRSTAKRGVMPMALTRADDTRAARNLGRMTGSVRGALEAFAGIGDRVRRLGIRAVRRIA